MGHHGLSRTGWAGRREAAARQVCQPPGITWHGPQQPLYLMRMTLKYSVWMVAALAVAFSCPAFAQFGGKAGDVVIYAVTYNGSGDFQVSPPTTTNTTANIAAFRVADLNTVPFVGSDPFPLQRQFLYMTD